MKLRKSCVPSSILAAFFARSTLKSSLQCIQKYIFHTVRILLKVLTSTEKDIDFVLLTEFQRPYSV